MRRLDPDQRTTSLRVWAPEADPTRFLEADLELDAASRDHGRGDLRLGGLDVTALFDRSGSLLTGEMQVGAAHITVERVWASGSLLQPAVRCT